MVSNLYLQACSLSLTLALMKNNIFKKNIFKKNKYFAPLFKERTTTPHNFYK
jgi:hypothetical protein